MKDRGKKQQLYSSTALDLAQLLNDEILRNNPHAKVTPKQIQNWAVIADRMMRINGRSKHDIENIIRFSQTHHFWSLKILSMDKLREKFDRLTLERQRNRRPTPDEGPEYDSDYKVGRPKWTGLHDDGDQKEPSQ